MKRTRKATNRSAAKDKPRERARVAELRVEELCRELSDSQARVAQLEKMTRDAIGLEALAVARCQEMARRLEQAGLAVPTTREHGSEV
ncbi:MAG: hypothetical protein H7Z74_13060 [Anaerolineae bacterium]|nr:hypothetical protein [Gemmatimonadaceae bacterium]